MRAFAREMSLWRGDRASWGAKCVCVWVLLAWLLLGSGPASAGIDAEAVPGEPFGVGRITFSPADVGGAIDEARLRIQERDGRIHYPAVRTGVVAPIIGQLLGEPELLGPGLTTVHFLFTGDAPLRITLYAPARRELVVTPTPAEPRPRPRIRPRPRDPDRLLDRWWREYLSAARRQIDAADHPPLVHDYLTTMLGMRLGLEPLRVELPPSGTQQSLELLAGTERLRRHVLQTTMRGQGDFGRPPELPPPPEPAWQAPPLLPLDQEVAVEPLAMHVPAECFYVRFGRFNNYLWLTKLLEDYGGDLASMVTLRSYFPALNDRVQRQLGLEQNKLAELFGEQVIADVALIGRDTYVQDGAAIGILFQARNTGVLRNDLVQQRRRALVREMPRGATEEIVQIAGRDISLVSTADNRLRSYYAVDGDFHLVTTSWAIVERFFAAGRGDGALGASDEFRHARARMPLSRDDTIFVYMSSVFFQGLLSPQYQIELWRRLQAVTDIELLSLARLAARGERSRGESIEELIETGFLPAGFGRRPDGSGPIEVAGIISDSRRGARGTMMPIPDIRISKVTAAEARRYEEFSRRYADSWRHMDPLVIAVKRYALDSGGKERVAIDGAVLPLDGGKYGWILSILGEPTREMITPAPGDVINFQAAVRGGLLVPQIPPHHLFLGVQDLPVSGPIAPRGFLQTLQMIRATPGYLGGWPKPGFLDLLPAGLGGTPPDEFGFSKLPLGLWKREGAGFAVLSFDPQLLAEVTPHLRVAEAEEPAQLRIHIGDLSQARIAGWINRTYYQRAAQASAGNVRLLHLLNQQLHVPLEECRRVAEELLDGKLRCPLGGQYELAERDGARFWRSSAEPPGGRVEPPADYTAPMLEWFRGLDASLVRHEDCVLAHLDLDMQRKPSEAGLELPALPLLDLFRRGGAFQRKKEEPSAEELPPPLPPVPNSARPRREF